MARPAHRLSIFAQSLDRAVFLAYFLGAVVPLAALAWFFVVPALDGVRAPASWLDDVRTLGLLGLAVSSGVLCLGSFLVLRRFAAQTLAQLEADRARMARLVEVSGSVARAPHVGEVARGVAEAALSVCGARAAYVFVASKDVPVELAEEAGSEAGAIYTRESRAIDALVKLAMEGGRPALVGDDRGRSREAGLSAGAAVPLAGDASQRGALVVVQTEKGRRFEAAHVGALATLAGLAAVAVHNADLRDAQRNFFAHGTDLLVVALDAYLDLSSGHSRRVAHLANALARDLGFEEQRLSRLHFASLLHDVGMLRVDRVHMGIPTAYRKHPALGARMLERIRLWEDLAPMVLHHHEWWDGQGYPEGLSGEGIPLEARIIGIAEAFDSMTTALWRDRLPVEEALRRVEAGAGTQFDPALAERFVRMVRGGSVRLEITS
jgi:putative nucleotidyltransferase with HDIG domain